MGSRMAARLLDAGYEVTVWNRTASKCAPLAEKGARVAATPAEAASGRDMVLANLTDVAAMRSVVLGPEGALHAEPLPKLFIDFATLAPAESAEIATAVESAGMAFLRASVSGTTAVAEIGKLVIIASGDREAFEAAGPILEVLSQTRYYVGEGEKARYLKLIHQMMIAATMQVWAEGLVMGEKAGLDWGLMLEVLASSAVGSDVVKRKAVTLAAREYAPAMSLHNIVKDLDLALAAAAGVGVDVPATRDVRELYGWAVEAGYDRRDYSSIVLELERRAGLEPLESD